MSGTLMGTSEPFRAVLDEIAIVAPFDSAVLLQGETGTGKELVARAIHDSGPRQARNFVAVNCAAIPVPLLESEFFGFDRGAFTGAVAQTIGRFQAADGGTLFLDEIGALALELQPKLLRVLQEQQVERLGNGGRSVKVDVRVIAATNEDLGRMVADRSFRADLYYRLSVYPIVLPALRERKEDIPLLVRHFVTRFCDRHRKPIPRVPEDLLADLQQRRWPGNIRELQNVIERAVIATTGDVLRLPPRDLQPPSNIPRISTLRDAERAHIAAALQETNGVVAGWNGAAARLGLSRTTLIAKMQRLGLSKIDARPARRRSSA